MPNVIVVGRSSVKFCDEISRIVVGLGIKETDGVITYSPDLVCMDMTPRHRDAPYLIVRHIDEKEATRIAEALNEKFNIDVEVEVIRAFLPRRGQRVFSKQGDSVRLPFIMHL